MGRGDRRTVRWKRDRIRKKRAREKRHVAEAAARKRQEARQVATQAAAQEPAAAPDPATDLAGDDDERATNATEHAEDDDAEPASE